MKTMYRIPTLLLLSASTAWAADPIGSTKTPEQVANLYIQAMNGNLEKVKELNDYLRPAFDGQDEFDVATIKALPHRMSEQMASDLKEHVGSSDAALDRAISMYAAVTVKAIGRSPCQTNDSRIVPNDARKGEFIAEVAYECRVPDVAKIMAHLQDIKDGRPTPSNVERMAAAIDATPADRVIHGTFHLYSNLRRHVWETGNPGEAQGAVVNAMGGIDPE